MKHLLTWAGIKNSSIRDALVSLLGKPIAESSALFIPTAIHPMSNGPAMVARMIRGEQSLTPVCEVGRKSLGVLELTALPSIQEASWVPQVQETDTPQSYGGSEDPSDGQALCRACNQLKSNGTAQWEQILGQ